MNCSKNGFKLEKRTLLFRLSQACSVALIFCIGSVNCSFADDSTARYGLWVEAEGENRPFDTKKGLSSLEEFTRDSGFTDLYCQVYRRGRSWFPSIVADDLPYRNALQQGIDPLASVIEKAHQRGQRVHAWLNALRIKDGAEAPLLRYVKGAAQVDNYQNSVLSYLDAYARPPGLVGSAYQLDTPGIWLDPSQPAVRNYLVEVVRDVVSAYPKLDGIHLDMIRFPFGIPRKSRVGSMRRIELGFSDSSLDGYFKLRSIAEGWQVPRIKQPSGEHWDAWRRSQVTLVVVEIRKLLEEIAPHMQLSAAVIAEPSRAHSKAFQDWVAWKRQGLVDAVLPMAYTKDGTRARSLSRHAVRSPGQAKVLVGLGAWLMKSNKQKLGAQAENAMKEGADGVVLFSYSNLVSPNGRQLVDYVAGVVSSGG
ncbi:MAG: family 10 glycosylhydrolase [Bdellovibrionales bacterium]|nr:family 10 glycosylhydrolase [Bdellovibrionales bacterium]